MLEAALAAGVTSAGGDVLLGGVLPTPAAPLLVGRYGFDLAAVISASHNPYRDNGIKFFGADGFKLSDATELAIEARAGGAAGAARRPRSAASARSHGTQEDYLRELAQPLRRARPDRPRRAARLRQRRHLPRRARDLPAAGRGGRPSSPPSPTGATSTPAAARPTSSALAEQVVAGGHDVGFAFDGDGDRLLAVDRTRRRRRRRRADRARRAAPARPGRLAGDGVAVTVMTNYGFHAAMEQARARDRHDAGRRPLRARGAARARLDARAASSPGHIIDMGFVRSGRRDRQRAADARGAGRRRPRRPPRDEQAARRGSSTSRSATATPRWPARASLAAVDAESAALAGRGRVLVRPSGTEPLVRVMVEAPTAEEAARRLRPPRRPGRADRGQRSG